MEKEQSVLVIFPHPDDEAFGVSGTIALHTQAGTPVTYACLTLGQMGRNMGNPPFANRETLPDIRRAELLEAVKVLGIQDLRMVGLRDKTIEFEEDEKMTKLMLSFIEEVKPSLIITFYPGYSVHPDHEATGAAVVRAVESLPENERPKLHCVAFSNNCVEELGEPDIVHDVTEVSDIKMDAIKAHRSQTELMVADMSEKIKVQDPQTLAWIRNERFWIYKF
ncbi:MULTISPECIES: bacillithiol biosynthesis deacetylase BshB2 [unclassified Bacillus (in: firmicutes)]|uniref:bacillithiol biosynthesis deacetylase BshB2 n=1 Tax=unclassified Bacillus (in: firmicutes) TaxID=185979 RepID=UPI0008E91D7D|nr:MULTISPECIES: bacillithiol biosynthesis deacetylase BshB2 [unclassified Bacillus (in: firmicutes)]SFB03167.1 bacillithiol biosynthesis deacetylase BshB2 [Bacillus sp. UNCCL13]SFQ88864.1 bacillithiol biosynthesis deacetylase BshB2 [Bacillus sp. cl95]